MQFKSTLQKIRQVLKTTAIAAVALTLFSGLATAQTYTNGVLSTGATALNGTAAPAGKTWSETQNVTGNTTVANSTGGVSANAENGFTVADDFTVTGASWNLSKISVYAYSTGYAGTTSPFNLLRVQIRSGSVTGPIVFGDLTTNRFSASTNTNTLRTFNTLVPPSAPGTTRTIWSLEANVSGITLPAGTYWLEFQTGTIATGASNFVPLSSPVGVRTLPGYNAKQTDGTGYLDLFDTGVDQSQQDAGQPVALDLPFKVDYTTGACAGTPAPGNTVSSVNSVCGATPFNLSVQNPTAGSGVTYQWQSSSTLAGPYTNITGATSASYTVANLTANTYYQVIVTCSGASGTSTPKLVTLNPATACYCVPAASTCTLGDVITNVKIGSLNNSSDCDGVGGYSNYTSNPLIPVPEISIGAANPMSVTVGPGGTERVGVWIDYNRNGTFETSEFNLLGFGNGVAINGTVTVPGTVTAGTTRMRVRVRYSTAVAGTDACTTFTYGETEDYTVNLQPCRPIAITAQPANATTTCGSNTFFGVRATGSSPSFYWEYRVNASSPWLNVANAAPFSGVNTDTLRITSAPAAISGYQFRAVFQGSCTAVDFSSFATLTVNPFTVNVNPTSASICAGSLQPLSITNSVGSIVALTENFDVAIPLPTGWSQKNNSDAGGLTAWFQGNSAVFPSFNGGPDAYIGANYNNTGGTSISNWLMTPTFTTISNGDFLTFYTRIPDGTEYPDRLEVRLSSAGASVNVGTTPTSVGDFGTLLLSINPTLTTNVYPKTWTKFTATVTGLAAPVSGKFAFRYFVTDDGSGANANFIGIDNVVYNKSGGLGTGVWTGGAAGTIFTDALGTVPYTGTAVNTVYVKPDTTTTYSVVMTHPNGCVSNSQNVVVTVSKPFGTGAASATTNKSTCVNGNASFTATVPTGAVGVAHQWKVSTNNGATYTNVANGGVYSGATTATLTLTGVPATFNNYRFKDSLYVTACASNVVSNAATLTVNANPVIVISASPSAELLPNTTTTLTAAVSPNPGATYVWYKNGVVVAGATTNTLVVGVDDLGTYTVRVNDVNTCGGTSNSIVVSSKQSDVLFIYPSPNTGSFQVRFYSAPGNNPLPRILNVFDSKGSRVYSQTYTIAAPYMQMNVNLSAYSKGIYSVEVSDRNGNRLKTGRVIVQ